ncbi:MAG: MBOAT family O-acyltransferase [Sphingomonadaceae bacterium]
MTALSFGYIAALLTTVALYWLVPPRWRGAALTAGTFVFLVAADWRSAVILSVFALITWEAARRQVRNHIAIPVAITGVLLVLASYKVRIAADQADLIRDVAIPLGLSYYSFRIIHYLIERRRGTLPEHGLSDYLAYLFFLPTLLVGPINRFPEFMTGRRHGRWSTANLSWGAERVLFGYFKIAVLANFVLSNLAAQQIGALGPELRPLMLYLEGARGALTLYMLFSGYSDIAIGFARMMGFPVMENFNWPFLKKSIPEFWRAWHISLTTWSREYVFMRVLGETRQPILATMASLLVIGLWHEISPRYILWGLYHGIGVAASIQIQNWWRRRRGIKRKPGQRGASRTHPLLAALGIWGTASWFFMGHVLVHAPSLRQGFIFWREILFDWWI